MIPKEPLKRIIFEEVKKVHRLMDLREEILIEYPDSLKLFIEWVINEIKMPEAINYQKAFISGKKQEIIKARREFEKEISDILEQFPYNIDPQKDCPEILELLEALPFSFISAPTNKAVEHETAKRKPPEPKKPSFTDRMRQRGLMPEAIEGTPYQICKRDIKATEETDSEMEKYQETLSETIRNIIQEELTKSDKSEIKKMISKELKSALEDELAKALKSSETKDDIGEIAKKVIKKLYKDLSYHHPYIIDRIKV